MPTSVSMLLGTLEHQVHPRVLANAVWQHLEQGLLTGSLPVKATNAVPEGLLGSPLDVLHTHPISLMRKSVNTVV